MIQASDSADSQSAKSQSGFDPYHKWLGIPPDEQPPNHYRILAITLFESDLDVIDAAATKQMTYVRQCATGPHAEASQQILNALSTAQLCLLDPHQKAAYDAKMKAELAAAEKSAAGAQPAGRISGIESGRTKGTDPKLAQLTQKLDKQKKQIETLLEKCEFATAISALEKMAAVKNPKLAKYAKWAKQQLPKAKSGTENMRESTAAMYRTANDLVDRNDYEEAAEILQQIPQKYRNRQIGELLQECLDLQEEISVLQEDIDKAESLKKYEDLQPTVERLLEIKPNDRRAKRLLKELKTYGKGGGMRLGGRGDGRFDAAGNTSNPLKVAMMVGIPLLLFGVVGYATVVYVRSNNQTIKIEIDDPSAKVSIDGNVIEITGVGDTIKLKTGKHDLVVERGDLVVHTREFEVLKGKNPVLRITLEGVAGTPTNGTTTPGTTTPNAKPAETISAASKTLKGHTNSVYGAVFSPNGKQIVSGSRGDNAIMLWDATTGGRIRTLLGHKGHVYSVAFSPDGSQIVSGSADRMVKLWDAATGQETRNLSGHADVVSSVAFSPDGKQIISGSLDQTIKVWDAASGNLVQTLVGHQQNVLSVVYSRDGSKIVSGGRDNIVKLWDVSTGKPIRDFKGHTNNVTSVAISPDATRIVSGCSTNEADKLKLWDASTGKEIKLVGQHAGHVRNVAFSPDGKWFISGSNDKTVKVWDAVNGHEAFTLKEHEFEVLCVSFSPDSQWIVSGSNNGTIKLWDVSRLGSGSQPATPTSTSSLAVAPFDAATARKHQQDWAKRLGVPVEKDVDFGGGIMVKMMLIPPGEFLMGSTDAEQTRVAPAGAAVDTTEQPQHRVRITKAFYLAAHLVTQAQYQQISGANPSHFSSTGAGQAAVVGQDTSRHPVENVSWLDAVSFCNKLSEQQKLKPCYTGSGNNISPVAGTGFRLPTDAEWELACRAGSVGSFSFENDNELGTYAWYGENAGSKTHPVGEKLPNAFGLYDMHGNLLEWCWDLYEPTYYESLVGTDVVDPLGSATGRRRVLRGGFWNDTPYSCRSAARNRATANSRKYHLGFRLVMEVDESAKTAESQSPDFVEVRLSGRIDGLDEVRISKAGAAWNHRQASWPTEVQFNGKNWNPQSAKVYANSGKTKFMPDNVNFEKASFTIHSGRGAFYFEKHADHVYVAFEDGAGGGGLYDLTFRFPVGQSASPARVAPEVAAIRVRGTIDGNQELRLFKDAADWNSRELQAPAQLQLNSKDWNPRAARKYANSDGTRFMPDTVKFQDATLTIHSGRGYISFRKLADHVYINFNDFKPGSDVYDVTVEMPSG